MSEWKIGILQNKQKTQKKKPSGLTFVQLVFQLLTNVKSILIVL